MTGSDLSGLLHACHASLRLDTTASGIPFPWLSCNMTAQWACWCFLAYRRLLRMMTDCGVMQWHSISCGAPTQHAIGCDLVAGACGRAVGCRGSHTGSCRLLPPQVPPHCIRHPSRQQICGTGVCVCVCQVWHATFLGLNGDNKLPHD